MARLPNAYRTPTGELGASLARAWFGDPSAAAAQEQARQETALRSAQAYQAAANGSLYEEKARGERIGNDARGGLPELIASMTPRAAAPMVAVAPDGGNLEAAFDGSVGPAARPETQAQALQRGLPAFLAAMGQMQGDKIDPRQMMGTFSAFMGDDEMARRGIVAQGNTPGENFAITSTRADQISARDSGEDQNKAFGVANIRAGATLGAASIRAASSGRRGGGGGGGGSRGGGGGSAKPPKPAKPKSVSTATANYFAKQLTALEESHKVKISPATRESILAKAAEEFSRTGDVVGSFQRASSRLVVDGRNIRERDNEGNWMMGAPTQAAPQSQPPAPQPKRPRPAASVFTRNGTPKMADDAAAEAFTSNPANRGRMFIAPDGTTMKVL